jgi:hypothetical protein
MLAPYVQNPDNPRLPNPGTWSSEVLRLAATD